MSYPVLSSHVGLGAKRLRLLGVSPSTIRLSVGIEDGGDLISDLKQALSAPEPNRGHRSIAIPPFDPDFLRCCVPPE